MHSGFDNVTLIRNYIQKFDIPYYCLFIYLYILDIYNVYLFLIFILLLLLLLLLLYNSFFIQFFQLNYYFQEFVQHFSSDPRTC